MPSRDGFPPQPLSTVRTRAVFAALYGAEGAPIGLLFVALPVLMREQGAEIHDIAALQAALVLPWALKWLWAPLVDVLRGPRWPLRAWIVAAQVGMVATLLPLLWLEPIDFLGPAAALLVLHAVCAATHDVAIDALAIASVPPDGRPALNAWMQVGMRVGMAGFGGGALLVREDLGDGAVVAMLLAVLVLALGAAFALAEPPLRREARPWRAFGATVVAAARRRATWLGLAFAATAGAGFETVGALAKLWLLDRGTSTGGVGLFLAVPTILGLVLGGFAGAALARRRGNAAAAVASGALVVVTVLGAAAAAASGAGATAAGLTVLTVYVAAGALTTSSYALLMDLTDPRLASTQFSAFMGATNLCEAASDWCGGRIAHASGYAWAFAAAAAVSAGALLLVLPLRRSPRA